MHATGYIVLLLRPDEIDLAGQLLVALAGQREQSDIVYMLPMQKLEVFVYAPWKLVEREHSLCCRPRLIVQHSHHATFDDAAVTFRVTACDPIPQSKSGH